ncbi:hypothetical protein JI435_034590, partial [Parastagonospora nodorum SN15]
GVRYRRYDHAAIAYNDLPQRAISCCCSHGKHRLRKLAMAAQRPVRNECMHLWCNLLHIPVRPSAYVHLLGPAKL